MHSQLDRGGLVGFLIIGGMVASQVGGVGSHLGPRVLSLTMLPFALVLLLSPLRLRRSLGLMGIAMVALTLSRMAFVIGVVVAVVVFVFRNQRRRTIRITVTLTALVAAYTILSRWGTFSSRWVTGDTTLRIAGFRVNASGRTKVWSALYESAWESPFLGHGLGSSRAAAEEIIPGLGHPHNEYLRLFFELGIPGVLLFGWFVVRRAQVLVYRLRNRVGERRFVLGALCALLGLAMAMASDNPLVYVTFLVPTALVIGAGEPLAVAGEGSDVPHVRKSVDHRPSTRR
jgi:O-antigen ligase